jgi:membrane peptidoglycan carboxypeptidase
VVTPQAAYIVTDILAGNTDPDQNPFWGKFKLTDENGDRRPAAFKTGTNNEAKDLTAAGYVAPPDNSGSDDEHYSLVTAVWAGNSDGSVVSTPDNPVFSVDVTAPMWQGFMDEATKTWPIKDFDKPGGLVNADVDAWSGGKPTEFTTKTVKEVFIAGTEPGADPIHVGKDVIVDANGTVYIWHEGCTGVPEKKGFLDFSTVEQGNPNYVAANDDWILRAKQGVGIEGGPHPDVKTATSYFYNSIYHPYGKNWGAPFPPELDCSLAATPVAAAVPVAVRDDGPVRLAVPCLSVSFAVALALAIAIRDADRDDHARADRPTHTTADANANPNRQHHRRRTSLVTRRAVPRHSRLTSPTSRRAARQRPGSGNSATAIQHSAKSETQLHRGWDLHGQLDRDQRWRVGHQDDPGLHHGQRTVRR